MRVLSIAIAVFFLSSCACVQKADQSNAIAANVIGQYQVQKEIEDDIRSKLEEQLVRLAGPGNFHVTVTIQLDWIEKTVHNIHYDANNPAMVSQKSYAEATAQPHPLGPPGIDSNVQDTGIGASGQTSIEESVSNYVFPWFDTHIRESIGTIDELSVGVAIDYRWNENGERVPYSVNELESIERLLRASINIPLTDSPSGPYTLVVENIPFAE